MSQGEKRGTDVRDRLRKKRGALLFGGRVEALRSVGQTDKTEEELEQFAEEQSEKGAGFRALFYIIVFLLIVLLVYLKIDRDTVTPDTGAVEARMAASGVDPDKELHDFVETLGLQRTVAEGAVEGDSAKPAGRISRADIKRRYEEEINRLESCGDGMTRAECEEKSKALTLQYTSVASTVEKDFYSLLRVNPKRADPASIRKAHAEAIANPDLSSTEVAALTEARDILLNPETRLYYNLYGMYPPESMKHTTSRHGGWGQEFLQHTWGFKVAEAWMTYFNHSWLIQFAVVSVMFLGPMWLSLMGRFSQLVFRTNDIIGQESEDDSDSD